MAKAWSVRHWVWVLLLAGCAALLTAVAGVAMVGVHLARPARADIGSAPEDLQAEPVSFLSASGARIVGWFCPGQPGAGAVVLMHGVRSNRTSMIRRARMLRAAGFAVLLFDFQAHGASGGDRITFGWRESDDARAAVAFLAGRVPGERIGAIGVSLGGAAALLGVEKLPVQALVLETVYADIDSTMGNRLRAHLPAPAAVVIHALFGVLMRPVLGIPRDRLRPIERIGAVTAPLLVAAAAEDDRTPLAESQALYGAATAEKQFWAVAGARHVDLAAFAPDEYQRVVVEFLQTRLGLPRR